jgi:hypothetical protein
MMCSGVSKSGSPWESPMMSRPAARSSRVRWAEDAEAEIFARLTRLERKATLVRNDGGVADDARPFVPLAPDVLRERLGRSAHRLGALLH